MAKVDLKNTKQRAIIICAGEESRWKNYLGVNKHFITLNDEVLIERTIRLLKENGIEDTYVVAKDSRYNFVDTNLYIPNLEPENGGIDKFLSSESLWLDDGRTLIIYGDVYYTDEAMRTICNHAHKDWQLYARPFGSETTRCPWGECFAISFYPDHIPEYKRALNKCVELYQTKKKEYKDLGGWHVYRLMLGLNERQIINPFWGDRLKIIDDFTDDFDDKDDYLRWIENFNNE